MYPYKSKGNQLAEILTLVYSWDREAVAGFDTHYFVKFSHLSLFNLCWSLDTQNHTADLPFSLGYQCTEQLHPFNT